MKDIQFTLNLLKLRKENGMTQQDIASVLGTSQQNYQRYESGAVEPDIETLLKLAKIFDVTLDELIEVK